MTSLIEPIKIKKKIAQLIVSNIMYPEIKKDTERNNKRFSDKIFEYFGMYNYKT